MVKYNLKKLIPGAVLGLGLAAVAGCASQESKYASMMNSLDQRVAVSPVYRAMVKSDLDSSTSTAAYVAEDLDSIDSIMADKPTVDPARFDKETLNKPDTGSFGEPATETADYTDKPIDFWKNGQTMLVNGGVYAVGCEDDGANKALIKTVASNRARSTLVAYLNGRNENGFSSGKTGNGQVKILGPRIINGKVCYQAFKSLQAPVK